MTLSLFRCVCFLSILRVGSNSAHSASSDFSTLNERLERLEQQNAQLQALLAISAPTVRRLVDPQAQEDQLKEVEVGKNCAARSYDDSAWLLQNGFVIISMQAGFAMLEVGSVQSTNAVNIMMKNITDMCCGAFVWWAVGWALVSGESNGFFGTSGFFSTGNHDYALWFFQFSFAATAATIDSGCVAGRFSFPAYIAMSCWMTMWTYPVVAHWAWAPYGLLSRQGFIDFAGSAVVHVVGGVSGLIATMWVGPRHGVFSQTPGKRKVYHPNVVPVQTPAEVSVGSESDTESMASDFVDEPVFSNSPIYLLYGTFLLWIGWFGFNCGSTAGLMNGWGSVAGLVAMNTTLGGAGGGIVGMLWSILTSNARIRRMQRALRRSSKTAMRKMSNFARPGIVFSVQHISCSIIAGLVAVTAGCHVISAWEALLIGAVGAVLCLYSIGKMHEWQIDDPCNAVSIHAAAGVWGVVATGLFAHAQSCSAPVISTHGLDGLNAVSLVAATATATGPGVFTVRDDRLGWVGGEEGLFWSGSPRLLLMEIAGVLFIATWTVVNTVACLWMLEKVCGIKFRVSKEAELAGLDQSEHGIDFQADLVQNLAKMHNTLLAMPSENQMTVRAIMRSFVAHLELDEFKQKPRPEEDPGQELGQELAQDAQDDGVSTPYSASAHASTAGSAGHEEVQQAIYSLEPPVTPSLSASPRRLQTIKTPAEHSKSEQLKSGSPRKTSLDTLGVIDTPDTPTTSTQSRRQRKAGKYKEEYATIGVSTVSYHETLRALNASLIHKRGGVTGPPAAHAARAAHTREHDRSAATAATVESEKSAENTAAVHGNSKNDDADANEDPSVDA